MAGALVAVVAVIDRKNSTMVLVMMEAANMAKTVATAVPIVLHVYDMITFTIGMIEVTGETGATGATWSLEPKWWSHWLVLWRTSLGDYRERYGSCAVSIKG